MRGARSRILDAFNIEIATADTAPPFTFEPIMFVSPPLTIDTLFEPVTWVLLTVVSVSFASPCEFDNEACQVAKRHKRQYGPQSAH
ncbi:hypothetical protein SAMN05216550_1252 [Paraburkholderia tropica]|uniref:Uncharacterized protein n=1 Tax=Paraburkholderia tropica TaxID=92647 RepID=A0AAQ1JXW9_9BURK|nr:hypothetical protein SAMN05216550_1252 [Paraburkholderia tropica]